MKSYTIDQVVNGFVVRESDPGREYLCVGRETIRVFNDFGEMVKALKADFFAKQEIVIHNKT